MSDAPLLPDPDGMNNKRACWANDALRLFSELTDADLYDEALGDLLCDLMHWCDRNNVDFELALNRARGRYTKETQGELIENCCPHCGSASRSL